MLTTSLSPLAKRVGLAGAVTLAAVGSAGTYGATRPKQVQGLDRNEASIGALLLGVTSAVAWSAAVQRGTSSSFSAGARYAQAISAAAFVGVAVPFAARGIVEEFAD